MTGRRDQGPLRSSRVRRRQDAHDWIDAEALRGATHSDKLGNRDGAKDDGVTQLKGDW